MSLNNFFQYINGNEVVTHEGGHLPIMAEITDKIQYGESNLVTICINNTLTPETIPQGNIIHKSDLTRYYQGLAILLYKNVHNLSVI